MRHIHAILLGATLASSAAGCGSSSPSQSSGQAPPDPSVGSSEARLTLAVQGSGSASLKVTATADATGQVVLDQSADLKAGGATMLDLALAPESYTFHVDAFADAAQKTLLGSGDARANLAAGLTTDIKLTTTVMAGASAGAGASGKVEGKVDVAPQIGGIHVTLAGNGSLGAGATADTIAQVHVDATAANGGSLSFFWSGYGIGAAVEGGATIDLSAAAAAQLQGPPVVKVVVQDAAGVTAETSISIDGSAGATASGGGSSSVCLDANAQCTATCDASFAASPLAIAAHASCLANCGLKLASCAK